MRVHVNTSVPSKVIHTILLNDPSEAWLDVVSQWCNEADIVVRDVTELDAKTFVHYCWDAGITADSRCTIRCISAELMQEILDRMVYCGVEGIYINTLIADYVAHQVESQGWSE